MVIRQMWIPLISIELIYDLEVVQSAEVFLIIFPNRTSHLNSENTIQTYQEPEFHEPETHK